MGTRLSAHRRAAMRAPPVTKIAGLVVMAIVVAVLAAWIARTSGWTALPLWVYRMNPMTAGGLALAGIGFIR